MIHLCEAILCDDDFEALLMCDLPSLESHLDGYDFDDFFVIWTGLSNKKTALWPYADRRIKDFSRKFFRN